MSAIREELLFASPNFPFKSLKRIFCKCHLKFVKTLEESALMSSAELERYTSQTMASKKKFDDLSALIPGGVNTAIQYFPPYPIYISKGRSGHLWDVDGREYVDHCLAYGAMTAGHANPIILDAIRKQLDLGTLHGFQSEGAEELAKEIIRRYPAIEMLRFANTGLEATFYSTRLARAATGRKLLVKMEGAYHGAHDTLLVSDKPKPPLVGSRFNPASVPDSLGTPSEVADQTIIVHFNDLTGVERTFERYENQIAAVITEPVQTNTGVIPPDRDYFGGLRRLCDDYGVLLIIDEVKTGCNLAEGGGTQLYSVKPDLITFAKTIGGGTPLAAFGGKRELMQLITPLGGAVHYGTYNGNPMSIAAGTASLKQVMTPQAYGKIMKFGETLWKGVTDSIEDTKTKAVTGRCTMMGSIFFGLEEPPRNYREAMKCDSKKWYRYWINMLNRGVIPSGSAWFEEWMISVMHEESDIERTIQATYQALREINN